MNSQVCSSFNILYDKFIVNTINDEINRKKFDKSSLVKLWKKTEVVKERGMFLQMAFIWSNTKEGYNFWDSINRDWYEHFLKLSKA